MNKLLKFLFYYLSITSTFVIITSILLLRNSYRADSKYEKGLEEVKKQIEKLETNYLTSSQQNKDLAKINQEPIVATKSTEILESENSLGFITLNDQKWQSVAIYKEKTFSSTPIGKLIFGKAYRYYQKEDSWYLVKIDSKTEGWINKRFVSEIKE